MKVVIFILILSMSLFADEIILQDSTIIKNCEISRQNDTYYYLKIHFEENKHYAMAVEKSKVVKVIPKEIDLTETQILPMRTQWKKHTTGEKRKIETFNYYWIPTISSGLLAYYFWENYSDAKDFYDQYNTKEMKEVKNRNLVCSIGFTGLAIINTLFAVRNIKVQQNGIELSFAL